MKEKWNCKIVRIVTFSFFTFFRGRGTRICPFFVCDSSAKSKHNHKIFLFFSVFPFYIHSFSIALVAFEVEGWSGRCCRLRGHRC